MTKQEMLSEVEAKIRKDIPRLMELSEGCLLIKNEKHDNLFKKGEVVKISWIWNSFIQVSPIGEPVSRNYIECQIKDLFEVIGHEIMLNDVLEWLRNCKRKIKFDYKTGYFLDEIDYYYSFSSNHHENVPTENKIWNLSSVYLKDQSAELIKFLYNIVKE